MHVWISSNNSRPSVSERASIFHYSECWPPSTKQYYALDQSILDLCPFRENIKWNRYWVFAPKFHLSPWPLYYTKLSNRQPQKYPEVKDRPLPDLVSMLLDCLAPYFISYLSVTLVTA